MLNSPEVFNSFLQQNCILIKVQSDCLVYHINLQNFYLKDGESKPNLIEVKRVSIKISENFITVFITYNNSRGASSAWSTTDNNTACRKFRFSEILAYIYENIDPSN